MLVCTPNNKCYQNPLWSFGDELLNLNKQRVLQNFHLDAKFGYDQ
jgi:hypothetical protein